MRNARLHAKYDCRINNGAPEHIHDDKLGFMYVRA